MKVIQQLKQKFQCNHNNGNKEKHILNNMCFSYSHYFILI